MNGTQEQLSALKAAIASQDWQQALGYAADMILEGDENHVLVGVEVYFEKEKWQDVLRLLAQREKNEQAMPLNLRLLFHFAGNMVSCKRYQPQIYDLMRYAPRPVPYQGGRFQIILSPAKEDTLTIVDHGENADSNQTNQPVILSQGGDPIAMLQQAAASIQPTIHQHGALGILSVGDGYVMNAMCSLQKEAALGQTAVFHVIEPKCELLATCFMIHDYTGPAGPLQQENVFWYVGENWQQGFKAALFENNKLQPPRAQLRLHPDSQALESSVQTVINQHTDHARACMAKVNAKYETVSPEMLRKRFKHQGNRPPRVLIPTSRFTTVLKYAAMKTKRAFEAMDWEARLFMEIADFERCSVQTILDEIIEFEPDLIFLLDHVRSEAPEIYPDTLPVASWFQDHMPHLTQKETGQKVKPMDFILSFAPSLFIDSYDYPASQVIDMPMMVTEEIDPPKGWYTKTHQSSQQQVQDFTYVSHVSGEPENLLEDLLGKVPPQLQEMTKRLGLLVIDHYQQGGNLPSYFHIKQLIQDKVQLHQIDLSEPIVNKMVEILWNPLNSALYRQQALAWAADLADEKGLSLGIYGRGWNHHPRFAKYAKGLIEPGEPLIEISRKTRINLNLEPYACFSHNRLLDGLMAGGFFVVRDHPTNHLMQALVNFLDEHCELPLTDLTNGTQARAHLPLEHIEAFDQLVLEAGCITMAHDVDPVRQLLSWFKAGVVKPQPEAIPGLSQVSFSTQDEFNVLIERYLNDPVTRFDLSEKGRNAIKDRLTFKVSISRVVDEIVTRLEAN